MPLLLLRTSARTSGLVQVQRAQRTRKGGMVPKSVNLILPNSFFLFLFSLKKKKKTQTIILCPH